MLETDGQSGALRVDAIAGDTAAPFQMEPSSRLTALCFLLTGSINAAYACLFFAFPGIDVVIGVEICVYLSVPCSVAIAWTAIRLIISNGKLAGWLLLILSLPWAMATILLWLMLLSE